MLGLGEIGHACQPAIGASQNLCPALESSHDGEHTRTRGEGSLNIPPMTTRFLIGKWQPIVNRRTCKPYRRAAWPLAVVSGNEQTGDRGHV